jgi:hypothetical protein
MSVTSHAIETVPIHPQSTEHNAPLARHTEEVNESFVLRPSRQFSFEKRPIPQLRTSRDVLVRVVATGLCGSDVSKSCASAVHAAHWSINRFIIGNMAASGNIL